MSIEHNVKRFSLNLHNRHRITTVCLTAFH